MFGDEVTIDHNKHGVGGPRLRSPSAIAIGMLLRGINPKLAISTIVNMIDKLRTQRFPSESHLAAIWRTDPDFDIDCMLGGSRSDD